MKLRPLKDIHVVVKLNFIGRIIIYSVESPLVFSVFHHHKEPLPYWLFWFIIYFFWPPYAFLVASNSNDQKKSETRHMLFESFLLGGFLAAIKFDIWASLSFCIINLLLYTMIGGPKFFLKTLGVMLGSGILVTSLLPGFKVMPNSSVMTMVLSIVLIVVSVALMGISSHMTNIRLSKHRRELKEKQDQIISSLKYARTIQNSLMAVPESIHKQLPNSFVIWEPRDIVGGDIYYTHFSKNEFFISVVDCTGHGVPGALLSMVASSILQRIVRAEQIKKPSEILQRLNLIVKYTLYHDSLYTFTNDGMDVGICVVDKLSRRLTFSGARIPLLVVKNGQSELIKGNKASIGYRFSDTDYHFTDHVIDIEKGTAFYLFSDGITTQTGGEKGVMFGTRRLRNLLETLSGKSFGIQKDTIMNLFNEYHKQMKRKDDITMVGFSLDNPETS